MWWADDEAAMVLVLVQKIKLRNETTKTSLGLSRPILGPSRLSARATVMNALFLGFFLLALGHAEVLMFQGGQAQGTGANQRQLRLYDTSLNEWQDLSPGGGTPPAANFRYGRSGIWFQNRVRSFVGFFYPFHVVRFTSISRCCS